MADTATRIALITGANKGIGFEIARQLGQRGDAVLLGARDAARGQAAVERLASEGVEARRIEIDLVRPDTIQAAAAAIAAEFSRLDVLVNNAGIADQADGPPSTVDVDVVRRVFETNFFGTLAVTQAMLPLLRRSAAGRIVNVSSGLGSLTLHGDPTWTFAQYKRMGYGASKASLNLLTVMLAAELADTTIKVNAAAPGFTATDLNNHRGPQTVAEGAEAAIHLACLPDDGPTGAFLGAQGPEPW